MIDLEKEEQNYLNKLESGEFTIEPPPSLGLEDYPEWKEERDAKAFEEFLKPYICRHYENKVKEADDEGY